MYKQNKLTAAAALALCAPFGITACHSSAGNSGANAAEVPSAKVAAHSGAISPTF